MKRDARNARRCIELKMRKLLSIEEARVYLPVCRRTLEKLVWSGELSSIRIGRRIFVTEDDVVAYIEAHRINGKEPR